MMDQVLEQLFFLKGALFVVLGVVILRIYHLVFRHILKMELNISMEWYLAQKNYCMRY